MAVAFYFPLALTSDKIAPIASSPEAKLVAMSSNWLVLVAVLRPSSCTNSLQVVPAIKALITSRVCDVGELGALLGEMPNEVSETLVRLLSVAPEVLGVPRVHVCTLKVPNKDPD